MKILDAFGFIIALLFMIGFVDFGQGPDLTWWNLMHILKG